MSTLKVALVICLLGTAAGSAGARGGPPNDDCSGATTITTNPFNASVNTAGGSNDGSPCTSLNPTFGTVGGFWYVWTAPFNCRAQFTATNLSNTRCSVGVIGGSCAAPTCVAYAESDFFGGPGTASFFAQQGVTYRILAGGRFPSGNPGDQYDVNFQFTAPDECANAFPLTCGGTVQANLANVTSNPNDPAFSCRLPAPGRGVNTIWYSFVAPSNRAVLTTGIVSGGAANDTLLAVYSGTCGGLTQIGCNDDIGGGNLLSRVTLTNLTPGDTYFVQLAGYDASEVGVYSLNLDCRPDYDECSTAPSLLCNSSIELDLSICTSVPGDPIFPCRGNTTPGVNSAWVRFTAGHPNLRLRLLSTNGDGTDDTLMQAFIGSGCGQLSLFACNDNAGPTGLSGLDLNGIEVGREFWVQIAAKNPADIDRYRLLLECNPDCATCAPDAIAENEACGSNTNGLCTSGQVIPCDAANICGTLSPASGSQPKDLDFYTFTLDVASVVNWCVVSPQRVNIAITSFPFCPSSAQPIIYATASLQSCEAGCVSYVVPSGTYMVGIELLSSSSATCAGANNYSGTFTASIYCPGNLVDSDNAVDTADLVRFLGRFGQPASPACSGADLVRDGVINTADLTRFLGRFGSLCLPPPPPPGR